MAAKLGGVDTGSVLRAHGVTFFVDAAAPANLGTAALERSLVVDGGVFLRVVSFYPGSLPEREAFSLGMKFVGDATKRLGCELSRPEG